VIADAPLNVDPDAAPEPELLSVREFVVVPPPLHPEVVAPPFESVQSDAPVPETVPEVRIFVSVPWSATEDVTVVAVAATGI